MARSMWIFFSLFLLSFPAFGNESDLSPSVESTLQELSQEPKSENLQIADGAIVSPFEDPKGGNKYKTVEIPHPNKNETKQPARPVHASTGVSDFMQRYISIILYLGVLGILGLIVHYTYRRS